MFLRKLISAQLAFWLSFLLYNLMKVIAGNEDPFFFSGLGWVAFFAIPSLLLWAILSTGIDYWMTQRKYRQVLSMTLHLLLGLGIAYGMYVTDTGALSEMMFGGLILIALFWSIDRWIESNIKNQTISRLYLHKVLVSFIVSIIMSISVFIVEASMGAIPREASLEFILVVLTSYIPVLLVYVVPISWLIDLLSAKFRFWNYLISIAFHFFVGFGYVVIVEPISGETSYDLMWIVVLFGFLSVFIEWSKGAYKRFISSKNKNNDLGTQ